MGEVEAAAPGQQKFPPDRRHPVIDGDARAALRQHLGRHQAGRAGADHGNVEIRHALHAGTNRVSFIRYLAHFTCVNLHRHARALGSFRQNQFSGSFRQNEPSGSFRQNPSFVIAGLSRPSTQLTVFPLHGVGCPRQAPGMTVESDASQVQKFWHRDSFHPSLTRAGALPRGASRRTVVPNCRFRTLRIPKRGKRSAEIRGRGTPHPLARLAIGPVPPAGGELPVHNADRRASRRSTAAFSLDLETAFWKRTGAPIR